MINTDWATICGVYCGTCEDLERCGGCASPKGRAFCAAVHGRLYQGGCEIYRCAAGKGLEHCGLCAELPCALYDRNLERLPEDLFRRNRDRAVASLRRRAEVGTVGWLREVRCGEGSD